MRLLYVSIIAIIFSMNFSISVAHARMGEGPHPKTTKGYKRADRSQSGSTPAYSVVQFIDGGTNVTEFVSQAGVVFAVKWVGDGKPDLQDLFGKYYQGYHAEKQKAMTGFRGSRHLEVKSLDIQVQMYGHMRSLHGFAFLPTQVPNGIDIESLK